MYNAPLYQHLLRLSRRQTHRFHMPGHKGRGMGTALDAVLPIDYTEIPDTGNLYEEAGIIQDAEALTAEYYNAAHCLFLTCGATQGIKATIHAFCGADAPIVVDRNCHNSVFDGCVALNLTPHYIYPAYDTEWGITRGIEPAQLTAALRSSGARAAIITSPTYYGICLDVAALAQAAHACGAVLIVDSAHGAHLRACGIADAVACGADAVIFSAHKTAAALTQGAYLLLSDSNTAFAQHVRRCTAFYGTTSPSYPVMASLDLARAMLQQNGIRYEETAQLCRNFRRRITAETPFTMLETDDPCRLVLSTAAAGISGYTAAQLLSKQSAEPEFCDATNVVFIVTYADTESDLLVLRHAIDTLPIGTQAALSPSVPPPHPAIRMTPRQAYFSNKTTCCLAECIGKIAAQSVSPYPPGVPVVAIGEEIDQFCIEYLLQKGYNERDKIVIIK